MLDRLKLPLHWVSRVSATTSESVPRFHSHCPYSLRLSQNSVAGSRVDLPFDSIRSMVWYMLWVYAALSASLERDGSR